MGLLWEILELKLICNTLYSDHGPKESTKATAPAFTFGGKSEIKQKFKTPAPNAYDSEKGDEYLEGGIKHSIGAKLEPLKKFKTPAPNSYDAENGV